MARSLYVFCGVMLCVLACSPFSGNDALSAR
ncbi:MAG: hypothetical protein JWN48_1736 [Myxococcaceae bacterium]|nr:hypothetical protein [Myxococcaceae bacterium]